ncbi:glycoside hydrolase [Earliella scabrosa]|nr:glycoside hydrolase [Earliella scabrosa]
MKVARQDVPKLVVAHHIVGLASGFSIDTWKDDIQTAQANGIDGFALNVGPDPFTDEQVNNAYSAAQELGSNFKLFFSFDMNVFPCQAAGDADQIRSLTLQFATHPNQLQVDGKAFVSTFAGQQCLFGAATREDGWRSAYTQHPDIQGKIHFVPSFFIDPSSEFAAFSGVMDGDFHFNSGWPFKLSIDNAAQLVPGVDLNNIDVNGQQILSNVIGDFADDEIHLNGLQTIQGSAGTYMAAVAPWFFTHFPAPLNKNFIFDGDEHLWINRWENVIANRDRVNLVEIVTWNDYGESHYIGPIRQNLPAGSEAWVNGFDHQAWLSLVNFFATSFKTGQAPAIEKDQIVMWSRPHPKDAVATADGLGAPSNFQLFQDKMWAVVLASAAGEVTLTTSDTTSQTFPVTPGVNKLSLPIAAGGFMKATLTRNGQTVLDFQPEGFTFNPTPATFNYNAFVAGQTAQ